MAFTWTERDLDLMRTLAERVRFLSRAQVARTWWPDARHAGVTAQARLRRLITAGWVREFTILAHPELPLSAPVLNWSPGQASPPFGAIAYRLQARWTHTVVAVPCVQATRAASQRWGQPPRRLPRQSEQNHDLHMGAVFLWYRQRFPSLAQHWVSEEQLRRELPPRAKLPDALLRLPGGARIIEFGGAYPAPKVEVFHQHCVEQQLPYELW